METMETKKIINLFFMLLRTSELESWGWVYFCLLDVPDSMKPSVSSIFRSQSGMPTSSIRIFENSRN